MGLKRKRDKFKAWFWGFFTSKDEMHFMPDGPRRGNYPVNHTQNVRIDNTIHVQGDHNTVVRQDGQGDRNIVTQIMSLLSKHIIPGAAHDSSPRDPPPRCHPNTRVKLIARITAWIENQASLELLLWITGPAVVQTFAEYLAKSKALGASVFISRPNKRDNPHGVFITLAYQLATRIEAYRDYIVERLSRDPELLNGGMQAQFMAFFVEPFVEKKIGTGVKRWGILLDGLDELRGTDAQCEIIQTISTFAHEHRVEVWNKCSEDKISVSSVEAMWCLYCSKSPDQSPSRAIKAFYTDLFHDTIHLLRWVVTDILRGRMEFPFVYESLRKVRMRMLCYLFEAWDVSRFVSELMKVSPDSEGHHIGLLREVQLRDLEFGHLDLKEMTPVYTYDRCRNGSTYEDAWNLIHRPRSSTELKAFVSDLKLFQQNSPELKVVIVGGVPKGRVAVFQEYEPRREYIVPYPE